MWFARTPFQHAATISKPTDKNDRVDPFEFYERVYDYPKIAEALDLAAEAVAAVFTCGTPGENAKRGKQIATRAGREKNRALQKLGQRFENTARQAQTASRAILEHLAGVRHELARELQYELSAFTRGETTDDAVLVRALVLADWVKQADEDGLVHHKSVQSAPTPIVRGRRTILTEGELEIVRTTIANDAKLRRRRQAVFKEVLERRAAGDKTSLKKMTKDAGEAIVRNEQRTDALNYADYNDLSPDYW